MWKIRPIVFTTFLFGLFSIALNAQKKVETQHLLWTRYSLKVKLDDNYQIRQEIEERTYWFPWRQHQFLSRTFGERKLGKGWNGGLGFTYFLQSLPHDPEIKAFHNRTELRPQLELAYTQNVSEKISLHHRYWSDFRFFEQPNGSFKYGNNRSRYKFEIRYYPFQNLTLKAFDEILINIGGEIVQNVFDQNRYGASVQYMPIKNFGFELGYINWFQQQKSGVDFYNRHILRFTIHHTIDFKKSKI
ncbi:hypothetical protein C7S20_09455 [Christiangramia fulva]|uniref:DUF2490 domain-containing protein n=1 Tax=Christiangramia fulva TaxID=2126553 RepID=A0A2R3Z5C0_9FLAO|nr:DUF2490 domain-containing protein [Christiangramia fulva]AVR45476.1 hypothetical protein C7S20_09455 [Christiangramia fulva]